MSSLSNTPKGVGGRGLVASVPPTFKVSFENEAQSGQSCHKSKKAYYGKGFFGQPLKTFGAPTPMNTRFHILGNIARGKDTQQSSFHTGVLSSRAVDGKMDTIWNKASCILTSSESKPWWRVNLGSVQKVKKVVIINRAGWKHLREVKIKVGIVDSMPDNNSL